MNKLKALIIDDEQGSIDALLWELQNFEQSIEVSASFTNISQAREFLKKNKINVLFLDIQMPEMNGFEFLKKIDNSDIKVVFTSAHDQYAVQAFEIDAFDYLLKPVDEDDLKRVIQKLRERTSKEKPIQHLIQMVEKLDQSRSSNSITISTSEGIFFIDQEEIIRCEAQSNYTYIHLKSDPKLIVSKPLKYFQEFLDNSRFFRIHQSHLVNLSEIRKVNRGKNGSIELKDGTTLPLTKDKKLNLLNT